LMKNEIVFDKLKNMLGLNNYENYYELLDLSLKSRAKEACNLYDDFINNSIPPTQIINSLTNICSKVARFLIDNSVFEEENTYKQQLSDISKHGMTQVIRTWQILIKGLEEIKNSNNEIDSGLMIIVKICYASRIPLPKEIINSLNSKISKSNNEDKAENLEQENKKTNKHKNLTENSIELEQEIKTSTSEGLPKINLEPEKLKTVDEMLNLLIKAKEALLHAQLINNVIIHDYKYGEIELELSNNAETNLIQKLKTFLKKITGTNWQIKETVKKNNEKTIVEKNKILESEENSRVLEEPNVKEILDHFPDSKIEKIENNSEIKSS